MKTGHKRHFGFSRLGARLALMIALGVPGTVGIATMLGSYQDAMGATAVASASAVLPAR